MNIVCTRNDGFFEAVRDASFDDTWGTVLPVRVAFIVSKYREISSSVKLWNLGWWLQSPRERNSTVNFSLHGSHKYSQYSRSLSEKVFCHFLVLPVVKTSITRTINLPNIFDWICPLRTLEMLRSQHFKIFSETMPHTYARLIYSL